MRPPIGQHETVDISRMFVNVNSILINCWIKNFSAWILGCEDKFYLKSFRKLFKAILKLSYVSLAPFLQLVLEQRLCQTSVFDRQPGWLSWFCQMYEFLPR